MFCSKPTAAGLAGLCLALMVVGTGLSNLNGALAGVSGYQVQVENLDGGTFEEASCHLNANGCIYPVAGGALPRIGGSDRYHTATLLAGAQFIRAETAIIVGGDCYCDGASACGLAGALKAPVLLTAKDCLPDVAGACLTRLKTSRVIIVGGEEAVASSVEEALHGRGLSVERLGGENRAETAALVARRIREERGLTNRDGGSAIPAFIACGLAEADYLAAGPAAFKYGAPVLFVERDAIPEATREAIGQLGAAGVYIIGGQEVVSVPVERELASLVKVNRRLAGADRYETCATLNRHIFGPSPGGGVVLAGSSRRQLADLLVAAMLGRPVLFAEEPVPPAVSGYLQSAVEGGAGIILVGGELAVSPGLEQAVLRLVEEIRAAGRAGEKGGRSPTGGTSPGTRKKIKLQGLPETVELGVGDIIELPVVVSPRDAIIEVKSGSPVLFQAAAAGKTLVLKGISAGEAEVKITASLGGYRRGEAALRVKVFDKEWCSLDPEGLSELQAEELSFTICDGLPYLAFRDIKRDQKASVIVYRNGKWEYAGDLSFTTGMAYELTLGREHSGTGPLYLAYRDSTFNRLTVMRLAGGAWKIAGEYYFAPESVSNISLAIWNGSPYLAFKDGLSGGGVSVIGCTGGSWEIIGSRGFSAGPVGSVCLAAGGGGALEGAGLAVAFQDGSCDWGATAMMFNREWGGAGSPGISAGEAYSINICWEKDLLYIAYQECLSAGRRATVKRFIDGCWETVGQEGFTSGEAGRIAFQVSGGIPYIAFKDGSCQNKVTVMRFTGDQWETVGAPGFSAGEPDDIFLQVYRGEPVVA
ncbi:MAG TPA: hypothetical protein GX693_03970, partial [Firmicutes bacterium]|nr:hypothetical protein [Bacillota bacterium]